MRPPIRRLLASHALASVAMSLPWPWLLVLVWDDSHSPGLLGLAAASRMLPYVVCSWWAARLGDHYRRDLVVRLTVGGRLVLLLGVAGALAVDQVAVAVTLAALTVAVATPAYPALAAAMPAAARTDAQRATDLLVTIEVASFVVGPALGGLLLAVPRSPALVVPVAVVLMAMALALLTGVRLGLPAGVAEHASGGIWRAVRRSAPIRRSLVLMCLINLINVAAGVTLLLMARGSWTGSWSPDTAYGVASGALGFGALAAPLLGRCGSGQRARSRIGVLLMGAAVAVVAVSPSVGWALLPLLVAGAAAVHAESAATGIVQTEADDHERASLFGLSDACMVGAAMLGAFAAPALTQALGPEPLLGCLALVALVSSLVPRESDVSAHLRAQRRPATTVAPRSSSTSTEPANPASTNSPSVRSA